MTEDPHPGRTATSPPTLLSPRQSSNEEEDDDDGGDEGEDDDDHRVRSSDWEGSVRPLNRGTSIF